MSVIFKMLLEGIKYYCIKDRNNIGGISGYGKNIKNSYSLVKVDKNKARVGAIAGDVEDRKNINKRLSINITRRQIIQ